MAGLSRGPSRRRTRVLATAACAIAAVTAAGGAAATAQPARPHALTTVTVDTLPISNALPLDLGIKQGFFARQGIEIKKTVLQSGNDIVLALANGSGNVGYVGWVPAMIARTQGIPLVTVAGSEVEGTSQSDNWQNIIVKGSSSIRTPKDLAGKTIAVNALKGVGEVVVRAALRKVGVDPSSVKLLALPFPAMRSALNNGQVDAIWTPEPFMSQAVAVDGGRIVMAPGPALGRYWPNGGYVSTSTWANANPKLAKGFQTAINESLQYAQTHPDDVKALLPANQSGLRLPIWSPLIDTAKLAQLAQYAKDFGVIDKLPDMKALFPKTVLAGRSIQVTVDDAKTSILLDGKPVKTLANGNYTFVVADRSKKRNFALAGPEVNQKTTAAFTGRATWTLALAKGTYRFSSSPQVKGSITVS
jgi:NitT/TauT family transport system substrate-binding protein